MHDPVWGVGHRKLMLTATPMSDYNAHRNSLQAKASAAHKEWLTNLSDDQKANLRRLGVLDAPVDNLEVGGHSPFQIRDAAESPACRTESDMTALDGEAELLADEFDLDLPTAIKITRWKDSSVNAAMATHEADLLGIVVGGLLASKNIPIAAAGLAFATNIAATSGLGCPAEYARHLGVSRSIVSKAIKFWRRQLNLRISPWQKSDEACATYSRIGKTNHWRAQKTSARILSARLAKLSKKNRPHTPPTP